MIFFRVVGQNWNKQKLVFGNFSHIVGRNFIHTNFSISNARSPSTSCPQKFRQDYFSVETFQIFTRQRKTSDVWSFSPHELFQLWPNKFSHTNFCWSQSTESFEKINHPHEVSCANFPRAIDRKFGKINSSAKNFLLSEKNLKVGSVTKFIETFSRKFPLVTDKKFGKIVRSCKLSVPSPENQIGLFYCSIFLSFTTPNFLRELFPVLSGKTWLD